MNGRPARDLSSAGTPWRYERAAQRRVVATVALLGGLVAGACVPRPAPLVAPTPGVQPLPVVVVSIDGLRGDAIEQAGATTLQSLARRGAATMEAVTVIPSRTLPAHTSMLTGVPPAVHGITWNEDRTRSRGRVAVATVFDVAESAGLRSAAFFAKSKMRHLIGASAPRTATAPRGHEVLLAGRMVDDVERFLRFERPHLLFVHIADPDIMGHMFGWTRAPYRLAVRQADAAVARIAAAADRAWGRCGYTLIVTADHGGHGRGHGTEDVEDMRIPWIAVGPTFRAGQTLPEVRTEDTAATVLHLLGLEVPAGWSGRPVGAAPAAPGPGAPRAAAGTASGLSGCGAP